MKVSINWLKEFVKLNVPAEEIAHRLTMSTVEVDEIIKLSQLYQGVYVGQIAEIKKHPNADNLSVAKISFGRKKIQIIFGHLNLQVGQKLPIVVAPATLPSGMKIERRNLRGVESQGMIASNKELGLDLSGEEITFFNSNIKAGTPIFKALELDDIILDLDVLSNRPDLFSHLGVAREVAAIFSKKMNHPKLKEVQEKSSKKIDDLLDIEIKDKKICSRYEARVIENIKVSSSPSWLKNKLLVLGVRPVNNIVDVTNYVMMELGQPMHAFDFDTLSGAGRKKNIIIRSAKSGEEIVTLDDKKRKLSKDILVIADNKKPIGIAGVMGGKDTEVSENTKTIILEAANFNWVAIRKAARLLGLRSEAVVRFEKGLDPEMTSKALEMAADLLAEVSGGLVIKGKKDINFHKSQVKEINVSFDKIKSYLGKDFADNKIISALNSLGFEALKDNNCLKVKIPSFRRDIKESVDIIEEVARVIGYDNIPTTVPLTRNIAPKANKECEFGYFLKDSLAALSYSEVYSYTFIGNDLLQTFGDNPKNYFELKNPLKPEHTYLRQNLAYSLIEIASLNSKNFLDFGIFEIANIFLSKDNKYPHEKKVIALGRLSSNSFFELKGAIEELIAKLNISEIKFTAKEDLNGYLHPQRVADIICEDQKIGYLGELHPSIQNKFDFKNKLTIAEIDFSSLFKLKKDKAYKPFSKFPPILLDLAIVTDERIPEAEISSEIKKINPDLIKKVELFDIYRGNQIETGEKSLAYHLYYQSDDRTLTEEEIKPIHEKVLQRLKTKFKAKLRN